MNSPQPSLNLLAAKIIQQWVSGQRPPSAQAALKEHPEFATDKGIVIDLAYSEYFLRVRAGETIDPETFCAQFPEHRVSLGRMIAQHHLRAELPPDAPSNAADPLATNPTNFDGVAANTQNVEVIPIHGSDHALVPELPSNPPGSGGSGSHPSGSGGSRFGPNQWPTTGDKIGDFNLIRQMGKGAFGRVYLAYEETTDRYVVVKISKHRCDEAKVLGKLVHQNVVSVLSAPHDLLTGLYIIAMPYHGSATLEDLIEMAYPLTPMQAPPKRADIILTAGRRNHHKSDPSPEEQRLDPFLNRAGFIDGIVWLGVRLVEALGAVHICGFVHHDLKPSNVLLGLDGQPRLLDFNLASDLKNTKSRLGGTLPYMPPEHLKVLEQSVSEQATTSGMSRQGDLFSFGVIMYELLTGTHPYGRFPKAKSVRKVALEILSRQKLGVKPIRERNPEVPSRLARLVESCLAYDPKDRPESAAAIATELRKCYSLKKRAFAFAGSGAGRSLVMVAALGTASAAAYFLQPVQATTANPIDHPTEYQKASKEGRHEDALAHLHEMRKLQPDDPNLWVGMAREHLALTDWRQARQELEKANDLRPIHAETLQLLGWTLAKLGYTDEALAALNKATRNGVDTSAIHNIKAFCYAQQRQDDLAITECKTALHLDPNHRQATINRAYVNFVKEMSAKKVSEHVLADVERAAVLGEPDPNLFLWAARVYAFAAIKSGPLKGDQPPEMQRLKGISLKYLQRAVEAGVSPSLWRQDSTFTTLHGKPDIFAKDWVRPEKPADMVTDWRIGNPFAGLTH